MIREIVRGWDWKKFKPPVAVEVSTGESSAGLVVINGQHTAIAAVTRGIPRIPVLIVEAASLGSGQGFPRPQHHAGQRH
jgi:hypothetical protein